MQLGQCVHPLSRDPSRCACCCRSPPSYVCWDGPHDMGACRRHPETPPHLLPLLVLHLPVQLLLQLLLLPLPRLNLTAGHERLVTPAVMTTATATTVTATSILVGWCCRCDLQAMLAYGCWCGCVLKRHVRPLVLSSSSRGHAPEAQRRGRPSPSCTRCTAAAAVATCSPRCKRLLLLLLLLLLCAKAVHARVGAVISA